MKTLVLLSACAMSAISCGLPTASQTSSGNNTGSAKTNVNAENAVPYSRSENAYTFAQNSTFAGDLTPSGKQAREIVGKTVTESKLWQNKTFDRQIKALMGPEYSTMRKFWNVETPIKKFGDFLMMTGCEKNNCAENQYVMFIDMGAGTINIIHIGRGTTKEWKDEDMDLPPPFTDELARLKSRG